ncbi:MAG: serine/threonine protein kinase [Rhodothermaceae bacterium]|nr:serine/threonine protein kinase [Rhodothermaceae bacterium]
MDTTRWDQIEALFAEALTQEPGGRIGWLHTACPDEDIRREVEAMLAMHTQPLSIERPLLRERVPPDSLVGTCVGPYRLLEVLGHGGMGSVWLAEHADGVLDRKVAVKLIRQPHTAAEARTLSQRFATERRILARLQHPGIVRLLDVGTDGERRLYFAMDYVAGESLTAYAEAQNLSVTERLRLFLQVCEAVHHAHQRLVVHRDLKPSNILVTPKGRVKLLDFGIARLVDDETEGTTLLTETGLRPMTRSYAAPEQIRGEAATTATDVYALGVVLYELLTSHRPFEAPTPSQLEQAILTEAPPRPSARLALPTVASGVEPQRLRGDLDALCLMALRKEPERRYASAEALATDVRRHLDGVPVSARVPSVGYRLRAFSRRHRTGVAVTAAALFLLIAFTVALAVQQRATARERDTAQATATFLADLFGAADPTIAQGDTLTALQLLERGAARIETELAGKPVVQADLLDVMSQAYLNQGASDRAEALARRAIALRSTADPATLSASQAHLADALEAQSHFAEADSFHRLIVAQRRAHRDTPALIAALEHRGRFLLASLGPRDSIIAMFEETLALRRRQYGTADPERGRLLVQYAGAYHISGDFDTAEELFREALREQRRHPDDLATTAETLYQLGLIENIRRRYGEADTLLREAALIRERLYGRAHPETAEALHMLANNLTRQGRVEEAEPLLRDVLHIYAQHDGRESKGYRFALGSLRMLLSKTGQYDEAIAVSQEVVERTAVIFGADSRSYATNLSHHGQVLNNAGRPADALAVYRRALPLVATAHGAENPFYGVTLGEAARATEALGRPVEAEALYGQAYAVMQGVLGPESYERSRVALALGRHHAARGDHAGALSLFRDAASVRVADSPGAALLVARATLAHGTSLLALGHLEEAEPYLRTGYGALRDLLGPNHAETRTAETIHTNVDGHSP